MIKLAVFDVDGTLVETGDGKPSEKTLEALQGLREEGILLAIASGRAPFFVEGFLDQHFKFDYYICVNGGYVMDGEFKEIDRETLTLQDVEELIVDFEQKDDAILFQFDDGAYVYNGSKRIRTMIHNWIGRLDIIKDDRERKDRHKNDLPFGAVTQIDRAHIEFYQTKYPHLEFDNFNLDYYDIHPKTYSKITGIEIVTNSLGIKKDNVIAFGDNYNDLQMIANVGIGVAMGNGKDEVKRVSDYVTKTVEEDGVYYACKHFNLL